MDPTEYTDTGLGWFAKTNYLLRVSPATLGVLRNVVGGFGPLPTNCTNFNDTVAAGSVQYTHYRDGRVTYWGSLDEKMIVTAVVQTSPEPTIYFFSPSQGAVRVTATDPGAAFISQLELLSYDSTSGLYYLGTTYSPATWTINPNVPSFSTLEDALAAITVSQEYILKSNTGYSVACLAKWKTSSETVFASPILISSESDFTDMEYTSTGYNMAKLNILHQGMRFYMAFWDIPGSANIMSNLPVVDLTGSEYPAYTLDRLFGIIASGYHASINVYNAPDPYEEESGSSEEEGGDGEDQDDDPVEEETLPVPSVAGHGFCTIYVPSSQELGQMASYLWSGAFDVTQVIKLFSNPMDSILGLSAVPVSLSGTQEQIYLGGVALTGITMPKYTGRTSVKVDFGTATIKERWGSYLDYEPYTEFSIYLPFIGIKPLKADDIMGKTISLMYDIDILSGGCVAYIRPAGGSVLYEWSGQCALQIPVTSRNYDNVFQTATSILTAVGAAVVAPASAPVLSGAVASAAVQAAAMKPRIERSGTVNGITGFLGQLRPYIIRTIPEAYIPADQNKFIGYPAYINVDLAEVRGYNEVDSIHLENVTATGAELEEIESILKGGVIF